MLTISFYSNNGQPSHSIRVGDEFYEWLAKSEFSQLGRSRNTQIEVEGEVAELPLVTLGIATRRGLIEFFSEAILGETRALIHGSESPMTQTQWQDKTTRLKTLLELLDCLKTDTYQYLQRE